MDDFFRGVAGGNAGWVSLYSDYGPANNKGDMVATGGNGATWGGNGGDIDIMNDSATKAVRNSGDMNSSGGNGIANWGGSAGGIGIDAFGGHLITSGHLTSKGGTGVDGGDGGDISLYAANGQTTWTSATTPQGNILVSGNIDMAGGMATGATADDGGDGGSLDIWTDNYGNGNESTSVDSKIALLGFDKGENLYLAGSRWDAAEIPLTIRRQPFLIGFHERVVDGLPQQAAVVHVDLDHPSVSWTAGEPVFVPQGGESPLLERVNDVLSRIHQGHAASRSLSLMLVGLELVESCAVNVEFDNGSKQSLAGLYTINEDRLRGLGASALASLHAKGHLQDAFMLLASLLSMKGLIERKNRQLSGRSGGR